jgi:hypothetical protein
MLGTLGPVKHAVVSLAATGNIVAGVTGKKIRLLALAFTPEVSTAVVFSLTSNATAISGVMNVAANTPMVLPFNESGWCETVAAEPLKGTITSGKIFGVATYQEIN